MTDTQAAARAAHEHYETIKANFYNLYRNHPRIYDIFARHQITCSPLVDEISAVLDRCDLLSGSFLDVGCGTGVMLEQLAPRFPRIQFTGVDPAAASLELARERCRPYDNVSFELGRVEELVDMGRRFDVAFSSWGHIQWNKNGGILESIVTDRGISMLVNNWGEDDDFEHLWPEPAIAVFRTRRDIMTQGAYHVHRLDSRVELDDHALFDAMSRIFGREAMDKHKKPIFSIGIVLAWKHIGTASRQSSFVAG